VPLTDVNLQAALDGMAVKKDPNSNRQIARPDVVVVVPKALEITMERIKAVREVKTTTSGREVTEVNHLANVDYVVEPMLDFVNTGNKAATTWFIVPKPGSVRPALWAAFLSGHEQPGPPREGQHRPARRWRGHLGARGVLRGRRHPVPGSSHRGQPAGGRAVHLLLAGFLTR
jgi:hypothetical protein